MFIELADFGFNENLLVNTDEITTVLPYYDLYRIQLWQIHAQIDNLATNDKWATTYITLQFSSKEETQAIYEKLRKTLVAKRF